jgi:hypothetical protein
MRYRTEKRDLIRPVIVNELQPGNNEWLSLPVTMWQGLVNDKTGIFERNASRL